MHRLMEERHCYKFQILSKQVLQQKAKSLIKKMSTFNKDHWTFTCPSFSSSSTKFHDMICYKKNKQQVMLEFMCPPVWAEIPFLIDRCGPC